MSIIKPVSIFSCFTVLALVFNHRASTLRNADESYGRDKDTIPVRSIIPLSPRTRMTPGSQTPFIDFLYRHSFLGGMHLEQHFMRGAELNLQRLRTQDLERLIARREAFKLQRGGPPGRQVA
jgi:hypothetical protein